MRAPRLLRHRFARSRPELTRADRRENPTFRPIVRAASALVVLLLAGCESESAPQPLTPEQSAALKPADARLAGLYDQACKSCHTVKDTGAPLTGDRTLWEPRWQKGETELLRSIVSGFNGMPAGGQCFACSPNDFQALIRFMAGRE
ncbi:cytochrome c5 family protein [Rhizobium sp. ARZ01]|nr:cytochrome c5 family protein [Rhizobium sp. ARZ01]